VTEQSDLVWVRARGQRYIMGRSSWLGELCRRAGVLLGYPNPNPSMATLRAPHACAPAQVWSTKQPSAVAAIDLRANVCCAKYNPARAHEVAVGCADHNVHLFDLRSAARPVHVFTGARAGGLPSERGSGCAPVRPAQPRAAGAFVHRCARGGSCQ
jgi:hypothetical protein